MQLVINSPGTFITQKDECFRLKQKDKVFDISPLKVESIVITNQAMISTQAIAQALENKNCFPRQYPLSSMQPWIWIPIPTVITWKISETG